MNRKNIVILAACLLALPIALSACKNTETPADTTVADTTAADTTVEATETATDPATEETTAAEPDSEPESVTEPETEEDTGPHYREDWDDDDPNNPFYNLIEVGTSYDGETPCYDGRYDFGREVAKTNDGMTFYSVQEAIDHMVEIGGTSVSMIDSTNICLKLDVPKDDMSYRIFYEFKNVDFVIDHGVIYDDCKPNADGVNGYCYYSLLDVLDSIPNLAGTCIWNLSAFEKFEIGRYQIVNEIVDDEDWYYIYNYILTDDITDWPGLPQGDSAP